MGISALRRRVTVPVGVMGGTLWHCRLHSDIHDTSYTLILHTPVLARQMGVEQLKQFFHRRAAPHRLLRAQAPRCMVGRARASALARHPHGPNAGPCLTALWLVARPTQAGALSSPAGAVGGGPGVRMPPRQRVRRPAQGAPVGAAPHLRIPVGPHHGGHVHRGHAAVRGAAARRARAERGGRRRGRPACEHAARAGVGARVAGRGRGAATRAAAVGRRGGANRHRARAGRCALVRPPAHICMVVSPCQAMFTMPCHVTMLPAVLWCHRARL